MRRRHRGEPATVGAGREAVTVRLVQETGRPPRVSLSVLWFQRSGAPELELAEVRRLRDVLDGLLREAGHPDG